jgi:hypothetical protein
MADEIESLPVTRLARLAQAPTEGARWLIEGLWAAEGVGCIGGLPKVGKTWLALEMAVAVASGRPCLGRFPVTNPGNVLLFCAEDAAHDVRTRAAGIAKVRGADFDRLAVGWIGSPELHLDDLVHRQRLRRTIFELRPRLLILDPLVRLHRGDENSALAISELLGVLRSLQRDLHVAVVLVHHVRKSGASEPGTALRGSGDLHAWGDSNLYVVRRDGKPTVVAEHRANRPPAPFGIRLDGEPPALVIDDVAPVESDPLDKRILDALRPAPLTRTALRERLGVRNETLGLALDRLTANGLLIRADGLLAVPVPPSADRRERNGP